MKKIECYHIAIKQVCGIERFMLRTTTAIKTHFFSAIRAFTQLELMRAEELIENWYELQRNLSLQVARDFILEHLKQKVGLNVHRAFLSMRKSYISSLTLAGGLFPIRVGDFYLVYEALYIHAPHSTINVYLFSRVTFLHPVNDYQREGLLEIVKQYQKRGQRACLVTPMLGEPKIYSIPNIDIESLHKNSEKIDQFQIFLNWIIQFMEENDREPDLNEIAEQWFIRTGKRLNEQGLNLLLENVEKALGDQGDS